MDTIYQDSNIDFLKEKIRNIKVALFKTELNPGLQLPNNIIQTLKVDNDGTVWFFTSCNGKHAENIDRPFYAYLSYQKKGNGCRLQISGKACIIRDDQDILIPVDGPEKGNNGKTVLIKMKIMQAEFFENKFYENISWNEKIKNTFNYLFLPAAHRSYNFSK